MDDLKVISGGILSSAFHSLTGPDHLGALLPFIFCKRWYTASLYGLVWGAGHGLSSSAMGVMAASLKGSLLGDSMVEALSEWSNVGIGLTLIVIGGMGLHELRREAASAAAADRDDDARDNGDKAPDANDDDGTGQAERTTLSLSLSLSEPLSSLGDSRCELASLAAEARAKAASDAFFVAALATQFCNGFLLGLAVDALPSVAPALSYQSTKEVLTFFASYTLGSMGTMGLLSGAVGESTAWMGTVVVSLPVRLAAASSHASLLIGCAWLVYAAGLTRELLLLLLVISPCVVVATAYAVLHPSPVAGASLLVRQHCSDCGCGRRGVFSPKKVKVDHPALRV